jgi:3-oxoacyl-[acyl-carrier protein] reductase
MIVLITGGSSGLGESITRKMATNSSCKVYFTYNRSAEKAQKITAELPNTHAIHCDFKDADSVSALKEELTRLNIDVLINNAWSGSFMKAHFHKIPQADFLTEFQENIIPAIAITQAAINVFRKKKQGKIITILTAALQNVPPTGSAIYVANKAYLQQLSKVWAAENTKYNITANTVSPTFMLTGFTNDIDERIVEQLKENHPLKQLLTTDEVADTVFFMAQASNQINGIDMVINAASSIK